MYNAKVFAAFLALALVAPAVAAEEPGVFKIPGTETTLRLNGFVEVDAAYDLNGSDDDVRGNDWAAFLPVQPLDNDVFTKAQPNRLYMTARTSRVGLTTTTPTKRGPLVVRVEGDFNDPSAFNYSTEITTNGTNFRIRHAYGQYGGFLVGQTWSNFMDLDSLPDTVEFNGHGAFASIRSAMIRYGLNLGPAAALSFSIENPQSFVPNGQNVSGTVGRRWDRFPVGTASLTMPFKFGHVNLRAMAIEYNNLNSLNDNVSKVGYGVGASGSLKFGKEALVWSVQGGEGIGHYMFQSLFQGALMLNDDLALWKAYGYHVGLTHAWSPTVRSNLIWTQTFLDGSDALIAEAATIGNEFANKRMDVAYANTFHSPFKGFEYGLEYEWGQRIIFDSVAAGGEDTGTMSRINALFRYTFY